MVYTRRNTIACWVVPVLAVGRLDGRLFVEVGWLLWSAGYVLGGLPS